MSLLFDALKRAQEGDGGAETGESQFIDLSTPEPTSPAGEIAVKPVKDVGVDAAQSILSATARLPRRIVVFVVGGLAVLLVAGGGFLWYYQQTVGPLLSKPAISLVPPPSTTGGMAAAPKPPVETTPPETPGAANVEPPLTEVVPVPPKPAPPPATSVTQGPEKVTPEVSAKGPEIKAAKVKAEGVNATPAPAEQLAPAQKTATKAPAPSAQPKPKPVMEEATPPQQAQGEISTPRPTASFDHPAKVNVPPRHSLGDSASASSHIQLSPTIDPLREGYKALTDGRLIDAERFYQDVIAKSPHERDALLGLAVIAHRKRQPERALDLYRQVLSEDPINATATAAMVNLTMQADPVAAESRLKLLLDRQPSSPGLYHVLGRVFALQKRWGEAQQAFFQAFKLDPDNAQYAYNLAVALDHMHKPAAALPYYEKAAQIMKLGDPALNRNTIEQRIEELRSALPEQR